MIMIIIIYILVILLLYITFMFQTDLFRCFKKIEFTNLENDPFRSNSILFNKFIAISTYNTMTVVTSNLSWFTLSKTRTIQTYINTKTNQKQKMKNGTQQHSSAISGLMLMLAYCTYTIHASNTVLQPHNLVQV